MTITSLSDISVAAEDDDLHDRAIAAAAEVGIQDPVNWVNMNMRRIVASTLESSEGTLASVCAYAVASYDPPPTPGADPTKVTDAYIRHAVKDTRRALEGAPAGV